MAACHSELSDQGPPLPSSSLSSTEASFGMRAMRSEAQAQLSPANWNAVAM